MTSLPGEMPFAIVRLSVAALFMVMMLVCAGALVAAPVTVPGSGDRMGRAATWWHNAALFPLPLLAGALATLSLAAASSAPLPAVAGAIILAACCISAAMCLLPRPTPDFAPFTPLSRYLLASSLLLCAAASSPRLDLFAPLSMKIMKFTHDFVHQFMESMLFPDHLFVTQRLWRLIGLLFSQEVGFWGGLILWFLPVLLVCLAIVRIPLPPVGHIRQGAMRRTMIAAALRSRRRLLIMPLVAALVLAVAVYRSLFPDIQYWDPAPLPVEATPAGVIEIPLKQGELSLRDGKLHKFTYSRGRDQVRFFVLEREGGLTVVLDACAICPPEGYGQAGGTVICYYCKTLIPLETVGRPGGCNPVPVPFTPGADAVRISAMQLVNLWNSTVQATTAGAGGGKK